MYSSQALGIGKKEDLNQSMEPFPCLKHSQVALVRAEKKTGYVLDEEFALAVSDDQKVYTVFDSLSQAQAFAEKIISFNQEIEVAIYSDRQEVLFYSNA